MILAIVLFFALHGSLNAQSSPAELQQRVFTVRDLRDVRAIDSLLHDSLSSTRTMAAFACGSMQDVSLIDRLAPLLNDPNENVRASAAFALGQLTYVVDSTQRRTVASALTGRLNVERKEQVLQRIIEGLGKVGDGNSLNDLVKYSAKKVSGNLKGEVALSIGRFAYRGIKNAGATSFATKMLVDGPRKDKWKAANALFRIGEKNLLEPHTRTLIRAAKESDPNVRVYIATALGKVLKEPTLEPLLTLARSDPDWRVRVNAIKALAPFEMAVQSRLTTVMVEFLSDRNEHISLTALTTVGTKDKKDFTETHPVIAALRRVVVNEPVRYSWRQQREAAIALAKLRGGDSFGMLSEQVAGGRLQKNSLVEALGFISTEQALNDVLEFARHDAPRTQRLAMESALALARTIPASGAMVERIRLVLIRGLLSNDAAVVTTAAGALAESLFAEPACASHLIDALQRMNSADNAESMTAIMQSLAALKAYDAIHVLTILMDDKDRPVAIEAAAALEKITGLPYKQALSPRTAPAYTNFDWALLDVVRKNALANIRTSRGTLTIRLLPDEAPFTCVNFVSLMKKGFFNGLVFHRVVPNFVVQGGDPHGDGWGGPGYTIRSEFGYEHYERGMVGMASSGKDTEGSQFFVTHSNQSHLDGRYTIFGRVTEGMDVVDEIQVGDTIRLVEFSGSAVSPRRN